MKATPARAKPDKESSLGFGTLRGLPHEVIQSVAARCSTRHLLDGEQIHRRGDLPDGMYWVYGGQVRVSRASINGKEAIIAIVRRGEACGVMSCLDGLPYCADAHSDGETTLLFLSRLDLLQLLAEYPDLYAPLISMLCDKLRQALTAVEELSCLRLEARLAQRLLKLARLAHANFNATGGMASGASQGELSKMLGASRQSISKHLQCWQTRGLIKIERRRVLIRDYDALTRIV